MGFGGPVWHASVSGFSKRVCRARAIEALEGVGDETRGQWEQEGDIAFHVRRRLSEEEEKAIGSACDIRGSQEARYRVEKLLRTVSHVSPRWAYEEAGIVVF